MIQGEKLFKICRIPKIGQILKSTSLGHFIKPKHLIFEVCKERIEHIYYSTTITHITLESVLEVGSRHNDP